MQYANRLLRGKSVCNGAGVAKGWLGFLCTGRAHGGYLRWYSEAKGKSYLHFSESKDAKTKRSELRNIGLGNGHIRLKRPRCGRLVWKTSLFSPTSEQEAVLRKSIILGQLRQAPFSVFEIDQVDNEHWEAAISKFGTEEYEEAKKLLVHRKDLIHSWSESRLGKSNVLLLSGLPCDLDDVIVARFIKSKYPLAQKVSIAERRSYLDQDLKIFVVLNENDDQNEKTEQFKCENKFVQCKRLKNEEEINEEFRLFSKESKEMDRRLVSLGNVFDFKKKVFSEPKQNMCRITGLPVYEYAERMRLYITDQLGWLKPKQMIPIRYIDPGKSKGGGRRFISGYLILIEDPIRHPGKLIKFIEKLKKTAYPGIPQPFDPSNYKFYSSEHLLEWPEHEYCTRFERWERQVKREKKLMLKNLPRDLTRDELRQALIDNGLSIERNQRVDMTGAGEGAISFPGGSVTVWFAHKVLSGGVNIQGNIVRLDIQEARMKKDNKKRLFSKRIAKNTSVDKTQEIRLEDLLLFPNQETQNKKPA
eukprot:Nk52_evm39s554 gene=Nk52_evmTU39s554